MKRKAVEVMGKISRRRLLKVAGGIAAASIPAWLASGVLPFAKRVEAHPPDPNKKKEEPKKRSRPRQWAMVIDLRKCDGCVSIGKPPQCTEACNASHFVPKGQEWIKVLQAETPDGGSHFLPRLCMHCENAPCLNVCPVGATYRDEEGIILIDHERCIGCRLCMAACPYGARSFNWEQPENPPGAIFAEYTPQYPVPHRIGTVEKCMFCAHHAAKELPCCAEACPMKAIYFGDLNEDIATNGVEVVKLSKFLADNNAFRLKEELGTRPRVWYIAGHGEEYGRSADDRRKAEQPRTWQEQGSGAHEEGNEHSDSHSDEGSGHTEEPEVVPGVEKEDGHGHE